MRRNKNLAILPKKPGTCSSEAAFTAVCNLLFTGKSTREENRLAVRHLLRQASKSLEQSR